MADDKVAATGDSSICFTWGHYFAGREQPGMDCFEEAQKFFAGQPKTIISNLMFGLATQGNFTDFSGYFVAQGPSDSVIPLMNDVTFLDIVSRARHCMHNFSVVLCDAGATRTTARTNRFKDTGKKVGYPTKP